MLAGVDCAQRRRKRTVPCFADNPENILAWLGPAIGPCVFEVGGGSRGVYGSRRQSEYSFHSAW
ncbi:laccase domain-containing protein [Shigella flexneri]